LILRIIHSPFLESGKIPHAPKSGVGIKDVSFSQHPGVTFLVELVHERFAQGIPDFVKIGVAGQGVEARGIIDDIKELLRGTFPDGEMKEVGVTFPVIVEV
jgi:hypothetical protein